MADNLHQFLEANKEWAIQNLGNIAYTLQIGREEMDERFGCVASSYEELQKLLNNYINNNSDLDNSFHGSVRDAKATGPSIDLEDDMENVVNNYIEKKEYSKLLSVWASGISFDWEALYIEQDSHYQRVSLPTYSFLRERYWIPVAPESNTSTTISEKQMDKSIEVKASKSVSSELEITGKNIYSRMFFKEFWEKKEILNVGVSQGIEEVLIFCVPNKEIKNQIMACWKNKNPKSQVIFIEQMTNEDSSAYRRAFDDIGLNHNEIKSITYIWSSECNHDATEISNTLGFLQAATLANPNQILLVGSHKNNQPGNLKQCYMESWIGFNKSLMSYAPKTNIRVIIYNNPNISFETLWAEHNDSESDNVYYRDSERHILRVQAMQPPVASGDTISLNDGSVIITGGLGKLGFLFAEHLLTKYNTDLILFGKSDLNAEQKNKLSNLKNLAIPLGANICYRQIDICNKPELEKTITELGNHCKPINGVIHAAGRQGNQSIVETNGDSFNRVLAPKIDGTLILDEVLATIPLNFICYFSSISAIIGDNGVGCYAMANRFQSSYSKYRNLYKEELGVKGKAFVINWPLWKDGGMGVDDKKRTERYLKSSGQRYLETQEGLDIFDQLLSSSYEQSIVITGKKNQAYRFLGVTKREGCKPKDPSVELEKDRKTKENKMARKPEMRGLGIAECVRFELEQFVVDLLKIKREKIFDQGELTDYGFDSISLGHLARSLSKHFSLEITPAVFFSYSTLEKLTEYFMANNEEYLKNFYSAGTVETDESTELASIDNPANSKTKDLPDKLVRVDAHCQKGKAIDRSGKREAIAIIGMSGRFPGARSVEQLWRILEAGEDAVGEIPTERFDWREFFGDPNEDPNKIDSKWCGCIPGIAEFDPQFFEISPREAISMDPRQRLLMQEAWNALEDAGYGEQQLKDNRVGMFVGVEEGDYQRLGMKLGQQGAITANHSGILASRLAYFLNLDGPALSINTACSSGLVAAHQACMSLWQGESDTAIAAGINLIITPETFIGMSQAGMLSKHGKCFVFDKRADGMVPGEAVAVVVLKCLSQALEDGDPIHGLIVGSGINYDGKTNGITAPSGTAQTQLLDDIYRRADISPTDVGHIVTHGTGTKLGDPVEINALFNFFKKNDKNGSSVQQGFCALTSTKTNFGHTFAASGLLSLISMSKSLSEKKIPASLHCEQENDYIQWNESPFYVNKKLKPWSFSGSRGRVGAVSAFGMSGTNAHMVLQEFEREIVDIQGTDKPSYFILLLSAKSAAALDERVSNLSNFLKENEESSVNENLLNTSYTLCTGRHHLQHRCAIVVEDREDAIYVLSQIKNTKRPNIFGGLIERDFKGQKAINRYIEELANVISQQESNNETYKESLSALAEFYCQGYAIPWHKVFVQYKVHKIPLPTYPFGKNNYWVGQEKLSGSRTNIGEEKSTVRSKQAKGKNTDFKSNKSRSVVKVSTETVPTKISKGTVSLLALASAPMEVKGTNASVRSKTTLLKSIEAFGVVCQPQLRMQSPPKSTIFPLVNELEKGIGCIQISDIPTSDYLVEWMCNIFIDAARHIEENPDLKVILIKGGDDNFIDIPSCEVKDEFIDKVLPVVVSCGVPLIASMKGNSFGVGWLLGSLCDIMLCAEESSYGHNDFVSQQSVSYREKNIFDERFGESLSDNITKRMFNGKELRKLGLACPIVAKEDIDSYALDFARELTKTPRVTLCELKKQLIRPITFAANTSHKIADGGTITSMIKSEQDKFCTRFDFIDGLSSDENFGATCVRKMEFSSGVVKLDAYSDGVVLITLCDEHNKNMYSQELVQGMLEAFEQIDNDASYRVVVLTGYNQYFACGGTKEALVAIQQGAAKFTDSDIYSLPLRCKIPVIAAMQGHGIGAGWSTGMFCDHIVYSAESVYLCPYLNYGFTPGAGSTLTFPHWLGHDLGREILFSAREYKGQELKSRGIGEPVLSRSEVKAYAFNVAHQLAQHSIEELIRVKNETTRVLKSKAEAYFSQELAMHKRTFVGNNDVLKKIDTEFEDTSTSKRSSNITEFDGNNSHAENQGVNTLDKIREILRETLAEELFMPLEEVEYSKPFMEMGLDSVIGVTWIRKLNKLLSLSVPVTKVYSHPTIDEFTDFLMEEGVDPKVLGNSLLGGGPSNDLPDNQQVETIKKNVDVSMTHDQKLNQQGLTNKPLIMEKGEFISENESDEEFNALDKVRDILRETLADELFMPLEEVECNKPFMELGLDSVIGVTWIRKINKLLTLSIPVTKVYSHPTIDEFANFVMEEGLDSRTLTNKSSDIHPLTQVEKLAPTNSTAQSKPVVLKSPALTSENSTDNRKKREYELERSKPTLKSEALKTQLEPETIEAFFSEKKQGDNNRATSLKPVEKPTIHNQKNTAIAVIGMVGKFPMAKNLEEYWDNLIKGRDCISEIPTSRWSLDDFYDPNPNAAEKTACKWIGALDDVDLFDPAFFNMAPRDAELMDPQQRLFMQSCWSCIEDSGYSPRELSGTMCGVFVGCAPGDYAQLLHAKNLTTQGFLGGATSILSARISYLLNLQGPCLAIDTACSSSLVAIASACDSLVLHGSDMAIAGGVCVLAGPSMHITTSKAGMLSKEGRCFTFDQRANGFVPGEGVGAILLKRFDDAINDNDQIHGVIKGWGVNQDGKTNGITAPNPKAQQRLEKDVYNKFNINPERLQLIEAHGTGTKLGDPIEIEGLTDSFKAFTKKRNFCAVGSVKSNIGHTLAASGIAGAIKVLLSLKHKKLPPTINFNNLNENISLDKSPFYVNSSTKDWSAAKGENRLGAVSSFGFSGTNAHIVIEEYKAKSAALSEVTLAGVPEHPVIIILSAKTQERLHIVVTQLQRYLRKQSNASQRNLLDMAYTLQFGRDAMQFRFAAVVASLDDLQNKLEQYCIRAAECSIREYITQDCFVNLEKIKQTGGSKQNSPQMIQGKSLSDIAQLWVKGHDIPWAALYAASDRRQRIHGLPTYPFAEERHWVDTTGLVNKKDTENKNTSPADEKRPQCLHPLVHRNVSDLNGPCFESTFTAEEFFLKDHCIQNKNILPGVAHLEMARAAVEIAAGIKIGEGNIYARMQNIVWMKPIIVDNEAKNVQIEISEEAENSISYHICSAPEISSDEDEDSPLYSRGTVSFYEKDEAPYLDIDTLQTRIKQPGLQAEDYYEGFKIMGINYGPAHQGISKVYCEAGEVLAQIKLPDCITNTGSDYVLHPSLLDSALQSCAALALYDQGSANEQSYQPKSFLPYAVEQLDIFHACPDMLWAWIRSSENADQTNSHSGIQKLDVDLCDSSGKICVRIKGFSSRTLTQKNDEEKVNEDSRRSVLHPLVHTLLPQSNSTNNLVSEFVSTFSGQEFFLSEHTLNDVKILPGVAYLEMIRAAGELCGLSNAARFKNIMWTQPIAVLDQSKEISLTLTHGGKSSSCAIISEQDGKHIPHFQGQIIFSETSNSASESQKLSLIEIQSRCHNNKDKNVIRALLGDRFGLAAIGGAFQTTTNLHYNETEALAKIQWPESVKDQAGRYILHPSIMNGVFETIQLWNLFDKPEFGDQLPFSLKEMILTLDLSSIDSFYVYAKSLNKDNNSSRLQRFNLFLTDEYGNILVSFIDYCAKSSGATNSKFSDNSSSNSFIDSQVVYGTSQWVRSVLSETSSIQKGYSPFFILNDDDSWIENSIYKHWPKAHVERIGRANSNVLESAQNILVSIFQRIQNHIKLSGANSTPIIALTSLNNEESWHSAMAAFLKSAQLEHKKVIGKVVRYDSASYSRSDIEGLLRKEIYFNTGDVDVRYLESGNREVKVLSEIDPTNIAPLGNIFKNEDVIWITGGLGGLGYTIAEQLSSVSGVTLILSGRKELTSIDNESLKKLQKLKKSKARVNYIQADIRNIDQVNILVEDILRKYGKLSTVIHSAGVLQDAYLQTKTEGQFSNVLGPKVFGVSVLDYATRDIGLDHFIIFSSIAGVFGNIGQADYSAANAFLDDFSSTRNNKVNDGSRRGKTVSLNWPLWKDGGMKMSEKNAAMMFAATGMSVMDTETGMRALSFALASDINHLTVAQGNAKKIRSIFFPIAPLSNDLLTADSSHPTPVSIDSSSRLQNQKINTSAQA